VDRGKGGRVCKRAPTPHPPRLFLFVCDRLATYKEWKSGLVPHPRLLRVATTAGPGSLRSTALAWRKRAAASATAGVTHPFVPGLLGGGVRPPTTKLRGTREATESRGVLKASAGASTPEVREQRGEPAEVVADVEPVLHRATVSGELAGHRACLALRKRGTGPLGATGQATDQVRDEATSPGVFLSL
jgi:hypothetical protein